MPFVIPGRAESANPESRTRRGVPYYVYLLASRKDGTLYLGVTRDLVRRTYEHKHKLVPGFTSRYDINRLVWFEDYDDPRTAIEREKEIKKWRRRWKIELIEKENPGWRDLYTEILG
jgi:putative endonuclease